MASSMQLVVFVIAAGNFTWWHELLNTLCTGFKAYAFVFQHMDLQGLCLGENRTLFTVISVCHRS